MAFVLQKVFVGNLNNFIFSGTGSGLGSLIQ